MMKNGKCPQCGSGTVHTRPLGVGFGNIDKIFIDTPKAHNPSSYNAYVCVSCGFFEIYLTGTSYLAEVAKTWSKVPVKG